MSNLQTSIQEYNRRILKLSTDLFRVTGNTRFTRFHEFVSQEIDTGNPGVFLFKHIENSDPVLFQRVIDENDMTVFTDGNLSLARSPQGIVEEMRHVWSSLSAENQRATFTLIQNLFRIARYVHDHAYDELLRMVL